MLTHALLAAALFRSAVHQYNTARQGKLCHTSGQPQVLHSSNILKHSRFFHKD
jgi:hypothetical protein